MCLLLLLLDVLLLLLLWLWCWWWLHVRRDEGWSCCELSMSYRLMDVHLLRMRLRLRVRRWWMRHVRMMPSHAQRVHGH